MHWVPSFAELADLGAASEAVGDDQSILCTLINGRNQHALRNPTRQVEAAGVVAEGPGHPAASSVWRLDSQPFGFLQQRQFTVHPGERLLMTMAVDQGSSLKWRRAELRRLGGQKFVEQHRIAGHGACAGKTREQRGQFISQSQQATRLKADDTDAALDERA